MKLHTYNSVEDYRSDETAFNYSYLKAVSEDPYIASQKISSKFLSLGDIIDILLTQEESLIEQKYYIYEENQTISDTIHNIVKDAFLQLSEDEIGFVDIKSERFKNLLGRQIINKNYYNNRKLETNIENILSVSGINKLYDSFVQSTGKIPIPRELYEKAQLCVKSLCENPFTAEFTEKSKPNVDIYNQFAIKQDLTLFDNVFYFKILVDRLEINHNDKTITPIDFKSTSKSILKFSNTCLMYRYDLQSSLYTNVLKSYFKNIKEYKDYHVNDLIFVVVSTTDFRCLPFSSKNILDLGWYGGFEKNKQYHGIETIMSEYFLFPEKNKFIYGFNFANELDNKGIIDITFD